MGGPLSVMFAGSYPERTSSLILYGTDATGCIDDDGTPGRDRWIQLMAEVRDSIDHRGEGTTIDWAAPTLIHKALARRGVGAFERASMSPTMARLT